MPASTTTNRYPMNETVNDTIIEIDDAIAAKYPVNPQNLGKWMLFYENKYMNSMWQRALDFYNAGELTGIISIKTSTGANCKRAGTNSKGVIRFKCGPSDDEALVQSYGKNVVEKMKYTWSTYGFVAYKTDKQTTIGTVATGAKRNFTYKLFVPGNCTIIKSQKLGGGHGETSDISQGATFKQIQRAYLNAEHKRNVCESEAPAYRTNQEIIKPSTSTSNDWLFEYNEAIVIANYVEMSKLGRWMMQFPLHQIDDAWERACQLYRDGELTGVSYMQVSTGRQPEHQSHQRTGVIICHCGPHQEEDLILEYGDNLVEKMRYASRNGWMEYKIKPDSHAKYPTTLYKIRAQ